MKITKKLLIEMIEGEIKLLEQEQQPPDVTPMKDQDIIDLLRAMEDMSKFFSAGRSYGQNTGYWAEMRDAIKSTKIPYGDLPQTSGRNGPSQSHGPLSHKLDVFRHPNVRKFFKNQYRELAKLMYKTKQAIDKLEL